MYNEYFGFSESPFENNLDQRFLFLSEDHKEVLAALLYFIKENKAFAMLCGDVGAGKTTLINCFLDRLPESHTPIIISNPSVEYREILLYVARSLGITDTGQKVLDLIDEVKNALVERKKDGKYCFLVIDEAHLLSDQSLDDIRLLSNIETPDRKLLPILLVGQYELSYKLQKVKMRQLRQRISVNRFLSSLDYIETSRYIDHRLKLVGSNFASCFETNCLPLIYRLTDGVPRQINQICDNAFLICKATGLKKVNKKIVKKTYKALRSDILFTPKSFKEKSGKSFVPWKILKPMALGSVIVLLFIGWLRYADLIKPLVSRISLQLPNQKVTTPTVQKESTQEKKSQAPQPLSAIQNPSSADAERKGKGLESNQQSPYEIATNQASTAAGKTEAGTLDTLINHSDAQLNEQQTVTSPKVIVQTGDNLNEIALRNYPNKENSGIEAILKSNPQIENRDLIYPGQVLILPEIETNLNPMRESDKKIEAKFTVQICTLLNSSRAFAEAYINELTQKGYPAYEIETKTKEGKVIYEIYIGKYGTKEEAEAIARDFQKNGGKPGIIIKPEIAQSPESKKEEK